MNIVGIDEVGRGSLFGPVVAGAVILSPEMAEELRALGVKDSKKLSAKKRDFLAVRIKEMAIDYAIGLADVEEIDRLNILQATLLAMSRSIALLKIKPDLCLIDGNRAIRDLDIPQKTIVGGDNSCMSIAAASIIAKVERDRLIMELAQQYPEYDLVKNKGYGTAKHIAALQKYGASKYHRLSFAPVRNL